MRKLLIVLAAAVLLISGSALADTYSGTTVAGYTTEITVESGVTVDEVPVNVGDRVEAGDVLCILRSHPVFCSEDGTAAVFYYECGERVDGTVLEVAPQHLYHLYCCTDEAYDSDDCRWIRTGETLYVKCTSDGTHRAIAMVNTVNGEDFEAYSLGGQLYIGETVYLYRNEDFSAYSRVGIATVVSADPVSYEAEGYLISMDVEPGESVQRGEKLFSWCEVRDTQIVAEESGIISDISVSAGKTVEGTSVATIVPDGAVRLEIQIKDEELSRFRGAVTITYTRADDPLETPHTAKVESLSALEETDGYRVRLIPEEENLPLGLSVRVIVE